jgi:hypothetical protein
MRLVVVVAGEAPGEVLENSLRALAGARRRGAAVLRVEGPRDAPVSPGHVDRTVFSTHAQGARWNAGGRAPESDHADALLFLPAHVMLPPEWDRGVVRALSNSTRPWGGFHAHHDAAPPWVVALRLASALRGRLAGLLLRDEALFFTRAAYAALGGFDALSPGEDLEMSARARLLGRPILLPGPARVQAITNAPAAWQREREALEFLLRRYNRPFPPSRP